MKMPHRRPFTLTSRSADRHALYELAVQQPLVMIPFIEDVAGEYGVPEPVTLREDFCGTAFLSTTWVRSDHRRRAVAVDLDPDVIQYARQQHRQPLGDAANRLTLRHADVLRCSTRADVIAALNFSTFIYKDRAALLRYLKHARRCLNKGGLLILDAYGGPDAMRPCTDRRRFHDFTYLWEQISFDPQTHHVLNHIHFKFRDGSMLRRAFTYDWRLWTLPELTDLLHEAGFACPSIWFESEQGFIDNDPLGEDADAWVAYIVAQRASHD